jgi:hypothetical protein
LSERLASSVLVAALLRRVGAEGGFGAVLHRGDATAGAIAVVTRDRGETSLIERVMAVAGGYEWRETAAAAEIESRIERARRFDPDLWVIELDIPDAARFVAEMSRDG